MHARAYLRQRFKFPWDLYWVNKTKEVYSFKVNWFLGEIFKKLFPDSGNHGTDCFKGVDCLFRKVRICSHLRQPPSSKKGNCKPQRLFVICHLMIFILVYSCIMPDTKIVKKNTLKKENSLSNLWRQFGRNSLTVISDFISFLNVSIKWLPMFVYLKQKLIQ